MLNPIMVQVTEAFSLYSDIDSCSYTTPARQLTCKGLYNTIYLLQPLYLGLHDNNISTHNTTEYNTRGWAQTVELVCQNSAYTSTITSTYMIVYYCWEHTQCLDWRLHFRGCTFMREGRRGSTVHLSQAHEAKKSF